MKFGFGCQLCSARGAGEDMTPQWSNLRAPFNNDACVNFSLFHVRRHNGLCHTRVPITTATTCDKSLIFLHKHSVNNMTVILLKGDTSTHTWCILKIEAYEFDMSYSKTRWGYSLKVRLRWKPSHNMTIWGSRTCTLPALDLETTCHDDVLILRKHRYFNPWGHSRRTRENLSGNSFEPPNKARHDPTRKLEKWTIVIRLPFFSLKRNNNLRNLHA